MTISLPAVAFALCLLASAPESSAFAPAGTGIPSPSPVAVPSSRSSPGSAVRVPPRERSGTDPAMWVVDSGPVQILLDQWYADIAAGDSLCFAVWCDNNSNGDIWGGLVSGDGHALSPRQISICRAAKQQSYPAIARGGSCFLVVWQDRRNGGWDVYGARVAFDGTVLDPGGFPICSAAYDQAYPRVTTGDSCWLVVWSDYRHDTDVFGARVAFDGSLLDPGALPVAVGSAVQALPAVAWNGTGFLVVWKDNVTATWVTRGARMTPSGDILDPVGFDIAGDRRLGHSAGHPAVASDGQDYLVVWQNEDSPRAVYATRVSEGHPVGDHVQVSPAGIVPQTEPRVSFGHGRYFVTWQTYTTSSKEDIWACRLTPEGAVIDTNSIRLAVQSGSQSNAAQCATARGWLVALLDNRMERYTVYGVAVDTGGVVLGEPERLPALHPCWTGQRAPVLAAGRDGYLAVWASGDTTGTSFNSDICATRLGADGQALDSASFPVTLHKRDEMSPAVAMGESSYAVVWARHYRGHFVTFVSESGQVRDRLGTFIAGSGAEPDIAYGAGEFLVAWYWDRSQDEIRAARVLEDGTVLDPEGFVVSVGTAAKTNPVVGFDGENFLVVWEQSQYIRAARVRPNGTVIDPDGFTVTSYQSRQPDVAFDGENYLVIWTDWSSYQCYGTRITPGAQLLDTGRTRVSWGGYYFDCRAPRVDFDGRNYVVAWEDNWSRGGIKGTLVTTDLVLLDSFDIQPPTDWGLYSPAVACGSGGGLLLCSGRTGPGMPWGDTLPRIWAAPLGLPPDRAGSSEEENARKSLGFSVSPAQFRQSVRLVIPPERDVAGFRVCDASGRCVRVLGCEAVAWDGRDRRGANLPGGVYVVEAFGRGWAERRKVVKLD